MRVAGILAEYNPFHKGHAYHLERTRDTEGEAAATHVVAVMSGDFVQRGEPAALPRETRVRAALRGGVDLVLELPLPWVMATAERFAQGGVGILDALGCVDCLSFGCESGALSPLERAVDALEDERFPALLRYRLDGGVSFPTARQHAVEELAGSGPARVLASPNNILAVEYLRALRALHSSIQPVAIERRGAAHDEQAPLGDIASASYIRSLLVADRWDTAAAYIPPASRRAVHEALAQGHGPATAQRLERAVLAVVRQLPRTALAALPGIAEGLENRVYDAIRTAGSLEELYGTIKTKRYVHARIRRLILAAFLGLTEADSQEWPPYIRILGYTPRGLDILSAAKNSRLPLVSRPAQIEALGERARRVFSLECRAADMYGLALPRPLPCNRGYTVGVIQEN